MKVSAEKAKVKISKGKIRHIQIEAAKNGVTVSHHREPTGGGKGEAATVYHGPEKPMVFNKTSAAHKHVKQLMSEMGGGGEDNSAEEMGEQEA